MEFTPNVEVVEVIRSKRNATFVLSVSQLEEILALCLHQVIPMQREREREKREEIEREVEEGKSIRLTNEEKLYSQSTASSCALYLIS